MVDIQLFGMVIDSTVLALIVPALGVIIAYLNYRKKPAAHPPVVSQSANNSSGLIQQNANNMSIEKQTIKINSPEIKNASAPIVNLINCTINIQNLSPLDLDKETVLKNISDCFIRNLPEMTGAVIKDASFELSNDKLKLLNVTREKVDQYSKVKGKPVKDANILRTLGNEAYYLGKPEDAFNYFNEALKIDEELKDIRKKATELNNIASVYQDWGKPEKALEFYEQALKIDEELKDIRGKATRLNNIASVYQDWGKPEKALEFYEQALKIAEELKDIRGKAIDFNNIASVYQDWGKQEKALEYYTKSLIIFNELKDVRSADIVKGNIELLRENLKN